MKTSVIGLVLALAAIAGAVDRPRVVCDTPVYDFGRIADTQVVTRIFILRNTGTATAVVHRVFACCGLTASLSSTNLPPGSNALLSVTLCAAGMRGAIDKPVDLICNDPQDRYCRVLFKGHVEPTVLVDPRYVVFDIQRGETPASREITIAPAAHLSFRVTNVTASAGFAASFRPDTGGVFRVQVQTVPPLSMGWHRGTVNVFSDSPGNANISVPVSVNVADEWVVQPSEIVLTAASTAMTNLTRWVIVSSRFGRELAVESLEKPDPRIVVKEEQLRTNMVRMAIGSIPAGQEIDGKALRMKLRITPPIEITIPFRLAQ
jgi:hypothetical protein